MIMIEQINNLIKKIPVEYGDVRIEKINSNGISYRRNTLENLVYKTNFGGFIRLYDKGNWVVGNFSSLDNLKILIDWLISSLHQMKKKDFSLESYEKNYFIEDKNQRQSDLLKIKSFLNNNIDKMKNHNYIKSADFIFSDQNIEKYFISTEGSCIKQQFNTLGMSFKITGFSNRNYAKTTIGYDEDQIITDISSEIEKGIERINKKNLKSIKPKKNNIVLLDPIIAGVLIHETIGHTLEADSLLGNKKLYDKILADPFIGCNELNIVDDATIEGLSGSYKYDDEGTKAKKNIMVKDGIMADLLSDCKTASILGKTSSGNARSVSYKYLPIVRMSNMFIEKGSNSISKLLSYIEDGYYAKDVIYGHHSSGKFIFRPKEFYEVKDGVIRGEIIPSNITGDMSVLKNLKIGDDVEINNNGVCHKGDQRSLPISISSPSILLKGVAIEN